MFKQFNPLIAPTRFEFKDPDTGFVYSAPTMESLLKFIINYRIQNELPEIEALSLVVENYLCSLPEHVGACKPVPELKRGFASYLKGGVALVRNLWYKTTVTQQIADKRSETCKTCPFNQVLKESSFDKWCDTMAEASVGNKRSKFHSEIGHCTVCSCPLRAKVWWDGKFDLNAEQETKMRKVGCWQPSRESR